MLVYDNSVHGSLIDSHVKESMEMRESICKLEDEMGKLGGGDDVDNRFPLNHHFAPSIYGREIFLAKGSVVIGKLHKHSHLNVLASGYVKVVTEEGEEEIIAPCVWTSKAGIKRAVYALEDSVWVTIHPTDTDDLDKIEEETIAKSYKGIGKIDPILGIEQE